VVVSAHGSASDRRPAPESLIRSAMSNRSRVERANRSRRVTVTTSPARRCSRSRPSSGLSRLAPLTFSSKIRAAGLVQCASLLCEILVLGGHSGISDQWPDFDLLDHAAPVVEILTLATKISDLQKP
jgi:hypothetical protein